MIRATSHYEDNRDKLHEIRQRESINYRDEKAREKIEELKQERKEKNLPKTRPPVYVCESAMDNLSKPEN